MRWVGVDGCRSGWIFLTLQEDGFRYGVVSSLGVLVVEMPDEATVCIDIPIGLLEGGTRERECDVAARRVLGPRPAVPHFFNMLLGKPVLILRVTEPQEIRGESCSLF
jgi:predicted RNase H-like nuclease